MYRPPHTPVATKNTKNMNPFKEPRRRINGEKNEWRKEVSRKREGKEEKRRGKIREILATARFVECEITRNHTCSASLTLCRVIPGQEGQGDRLRLT